MFGAAIGLGAHKRRKPNLGPATDAIVSSINAEGWSIAAAAPPASFDPVGSPRYVALSRQGFDASGGAANLTEALLITSRVRQAFPNQAAIDAGRCSLSDYVYSTDAIIGGATNNSSEISPTPVVRWAYPDRALIGNTLPREYLALVVGHRNARRGEQVACAVWTISDGTTTLTVRRGGSELSTVSTDLHPVIVLMPASDIDLSSLANPADITVNAKVYPWIGGAASVLDSAASTLGARTFCPQLYRKDTTRFASPYYVYVDTTGSDSTGVASQTTATAAASPCLTVGGALTKLRAAYGASYCDGGRIRLKVGTQALGTIAFISGTYTQTAEIILEGDPAGTPATCILSISASASSTTNKGFRFTNMTLARTAAATIGGAPDATFTFVNSLYGGGSFNTAIFGNSAVGRAIGLTISGGAATTLQPSGSGQTFQLLRGVAGSSLAADPCCVIGSTLTTSVLTANGAVDESGSVVAFNVFPLSTGPVINFKSSTTTITGYALLQNVIEYTSATNNPVNRPSGDSDTNSVTHLIDHHNSFPGSYLYGRSNILYDEKPGSTIRTHKLQSFVGSIHAQINTKGDWFLGVDGNGTPDAVNAPAHIGNWAFLYGVGCRGVFSCNIAASSQPYFQQAYPGLNASIGTGSTYATRNDPKWTAPAHTTWNGTTATAGAGNGNYALQSGSPCEGRVTVPVLRFDLAGLARSQTATAGGAYKGAAE